MQKLRIADQEFNSRLFIGTGKFGSGKIMAAAIEASGSELVTMALKRVNLHGDTDDIMDYLQAPNIHFLPNTSGARNAKEAVLAAQLARDAMETNWLKLEIHPDPKYLLPDPVESLLAAEELVNLGFIVLPYINADPVLCKRLEDVGAQAVMPLGAPIGSNRGLQTKAMLEIIIEQSTIPVIIDAGIGSPAQAAEAIELGADAVLVNTAIAIAGDPVKMAIAFKMAIEAAELAVEAKLAPKQDYASASSPLLSFLED